MGYQIVARPSEHLDDIYVCNRCGWSMVYSVFWEPKSSMGRDHCYRHADGQNMMRPLNDAEKAVVILGGATALKLFLGYPSWSPPHRHRERRR